MNLEPLEVIPLALITDRSWQGELTEAQLANPMYSIVDLFQGQVTYRIPGSRVVFRSSHRAPVLGHLLSIGELLRDERDGEATSFRGWSIELEFAPSSLRLTFLGADSVHVEPERLATQVAQAITQSLDLVRSAAGSRPLPEFFAELDQLAIDLKPNRR